jgi:nitrogen fixation/metabolism regulation signal transduction histidine kinase
VLAYSVDEALQPYRAVATAWAGLLGFGLLAGVVGATWIARRVSQPVEELAASARRIADRRLQRAAERRQRRRDRRACQSLRQHERGDRGARGAHPAPGRDTTS